jgi:hypothetical protein
VEDLGLVHNNMYAEPFDLQKSSRLFLNNGGAKVVHLHAKAPNALSSMLTKSNCNVYRDAGKKTIHCNHGLVQHCYRPFVLKQKKRQINIPKKLTAASCCNLCILSGGGQSSIV